MKETLYTIPLMDAFKAGDECPFCFITRKLEQDGLDFILGSASAYMQSDIREKTNQYGFCSEHYHKMFKYGNSLGNALMLQSYLEQLRKNLHKHLKSPVSDKAPSFSLLKKKTSDTPKTAVGTFIKKTTQECYLCRKNKETFDRYIDTFFMLLLSNEEFQDILKHCNGFCLEHFGILIEQAPKRLNSRQVEDFYHDIYPMMEESLERISNDISWFVDKFDYRNRDADWKNSKDAVQRGMQKVTSGYPADDDYRSK